MSTCIWSKYFTVFSIVPLFFFFFNHFIEKSFDQRTKTKRLKFCILMFIFRNQYYLEMNERKKKTLFVLLKFPVICILQCTVRASKTFYIQLGFNGKTEVGILLHTKPFRDSLPGCGRSRARFTYFLGQKKTYLVVIIWFQE